MLWVSHNSVSTFVMKLFSAIQPRVIEAIRTARSKIHIGCDGWTTKGGKRGLLRIVTHLATVDGIVVGIPIDLPRSTGAHTDERLAEVITLTLTTYGITGDNGSTLCLKMLVTTIPWLLRSPASLIVLQPIGGSVVALMFLSSSAR